jgi:hypothetical protein
VDVYCGIGSWPLLKRQLEWCASALLSLSCPSNLLVSSLTCVSNCGDGVSEGWCPSIFVDKIAWRRHHLAGYGPKLCGTSLRHCGKVLKSKHEEQPREQVASPHQSGISCRSMKCLKQICETRASS